MKRLVVAAVAMIAMCASMAWAHRIDELLQATSHHVEHGIDVPAFVFPCLAQAAMMSGGV